ncbi:hypothetical protein BZM26_33055 [Paraburkholderia strydomiana]|nr:hypothetical protein BZM26_33055 [Paraburkholderia strydomiana]
MCPDNDAGTYESSWLVAGSLYGWRMSQQRDAELLQEVVQFVNRMGRGDAPQWLKALDVGKYQSQMLSKVADFYATVRLAAVESGGESTAPSCPTRARMRN